MALVAGEQFPDDIACLTCAHVLAGSPIYLIVRDDDGDWQFLCNSSHDGTDARVIGLGEAVLLEPRLSSLASLKHNDSVTLPT
jgi:hypothetical protein